MDFNVSLKGLDGQEVLDEKGQPVKVGKLLASQLAFANKGDALKMFGWAQKLYAGEPLNLDKSDAQTLKTFIESSDSLTVLSKAQMLEVF